MICNSSNHIAHDQYDVNSKIFNKYGVSKIYSDPKCLVHGKYDISNGKNGYPEAGIRECSDLQNVKMEHMIKIKFHIIE